MNDRMKEIKKEVDRIEAVYEKMKLQKRKQRQYDIAILILLNIINFLIVTIAFLILN